MVMVAVIVLAYVAAVRCVGGKCIERSSIGMRLIPSPHPRTWRRSLAGVRSLGAAVSHASNAKSS